MLNRSGFFCVVYLMTSPVVMAEEQRSPELLPPVRLTTRDGRPIDTGRVGHAAPAWGDIDGDGRPDLLLGEYFEGRMRFYRNVGVSGRPEFEKYEWFRADGALARVPED